MDKQLNINDILNAQDTQEEKIEVPEWGGYVIIRGLTGEAKDAYEQSLFVKDPEGKFKQSLDNVRAKLISACVIGPDGHRMFTSESQIKALGSKSAKALDKIFEACQRLNAISEKDIEELEGNLETDQP